MGDRVVSATRSDRVDQLQVGIRYSHLVFLIRLVYLPWESMWDHCVNCFVDLVLLKREDDLQPTRHDQTSSTHLVEHAENLESFDRDRDHTAALHMHNEETSAHALSSDCRLRPSSPTSHCNRNKSQWSSFPCRRSPLVQESRPMAYLLQSMSRMTLLVVASRCSLDGTLPYTRYLPTESNHLRLSLFVHDFWWCGGSMIAIAPAWPSHMDTWARVCCVSPTDHRSGVSTAGRSSCNTSKSPDPRHCNWRSPLRSSGQV